MPKGSTEQPQHNGGRHLDFGHVGCENEEEKEDEVMPDGPMSNLTTLTTTTSTTTTTTTTETTTEEGPLPLYSMAANAATDWQQQQQQQQQPFTAADLLPDQDAFDKPSANQAWRGELEAMRMDDSDS